MNKLMSIDYTWASFNQASRRRMPTSKVSTGSEPERRWVYVDAPYSATHRRMVHRIQSPASAWLHRPTRPKPVCRHFFYLRLYGGFGPIGETGHRVIKRLQCSQEITEKSRRYRRQNKSVFSRTRQGLLLKRPLHYSQGHLTSWSLPEWSKDI